MSPLFFASLFGVFVTVALVSGVAAYALLAGQGASRKLLRETATTIRARAAGAAMARPLEMRPSPRIERLASFVPKSPIEMSGLRLRFIQAGYYSMTAAVVFSLIEMCLPVVFGLIVLLLTGWKGLTLAVAMAALGFVLPRFVLGRMITKRRQAITNALPDALDLMLVCLGAGSALDQTIVKVSDELGLVHPALGQEFRMLSAETRAGKPRIEAFKNLQARTRNEDIRQLVQMLVQTDKFGTSVSKALETLAQVSREKRRQRAEERAAKIGVKMVFPLVLCLMPALFVVLLGPAAILIVRFFSSQPIQ